jgi:hypothetical protein
MGVTTRLSDKLVDIQSNNEEPVIRLTYLLLLIALLQSGIGTVCKRSILQAIITARMQGDRSTNKPDSITIFGQ